MPPQAEDTTSDRYSTLCQRIQILTLLGAGGKQADVAARFGVSRSAVARLLRKAKDRGYNPQDYTSLTMEHVVDEQRAGRPKKVTQAKEQEDCKAKYGRDYIVQEDKAPCHNHHAQEAVYNLHAVSRLLWPGNSPDLNMIEPAWYYLKRRISRHGAPTKREDMEKAWLTEWRQLPIARIRLWIARIVRHIQLVIKLYGGNEYKEGTTDDIVGRPDLIAAVRSNCPVPWGKGRLGPGEACK